MGIAQYDILKFDTIGDFDDADEIVGTYQVKYLDAGALSDAQGLNDWKGIFADLWDIIKQVHSVLVTIRRVRGYNVTQDKLMGESAFGTPLVGTVTNDSLPSQVTLPMTFKTIFPRVMLRKLWGPGGEDNVDSDGRFDAGVLSLAASAAAFMMTTLTSGGHDYQYGYDSPIAGEWVVPSVAVYSAIPGTLRRRRIGVGS